MTKPISAAAVQQRIALWDQESAIAAAEAQRQGIEPWLVQYPSGLVKFRFAEPNGKFGGRYEVAPSVWDAIAKNGGKLPPQ